MRSCEHRENSTYLCSELQRLAGSRCAYALSRLGRGHLISCWNQRNKRPITIIGPFRHLLTRVVSRLYEDLCHEKYKLEAVREDFVKRRKTAATPFQRATVTGDETTHGFAAGWDGGMRHTQGWLTTTHTTTVYVYTPDALSSIQFE